MFYVHKKCKISDFQSSQDNAATYLRCGWETNICFVGHLVLFAAVKNFANRSRIDKVAAMVRVASFFDSHYSRITHTQ